MVLSDSVLSILVLASLALSLLALVVAAPRTVRDRAGPRSAFPADRRLAHLVEAQARAIKRLEDAVRRLAQEERKLEGLSETAVRHVGVVRYDAFEDMGGRLSFSAALLDGHGDGVVITSINGRQDTRCYAKQVRNGTSTHNLSDEERQAIREALSGARQIVEAS
jgi:uncharacterized protein YlxW (UPF0749 family)